MRNIEISLTRVLSNRHFGLLCLAVALVLRAIWIAVFDVQPVSDTGWFVARGLDMAAGRGYTVLEGSFPLGGEQPDPSTTKLVPTAFWPVGYPAFLALLALATGGSERWLVVAAQVANIVLYLGVIGLSYWCSKVLFASELAARVTTFILATYPNHVAYTALLSSEIFFLFLFMMGATLFIWGALRNHHIVLAGAGFVFGLAILTKPQVLLLPLLLLLILRWRRWRDVLTGGAVFYCAAVLVVLPWTVRNYLAFGELVFVSTNGGINLLIGNNPDATGSYMWPRAFDGLIVMTFSELERDKGARDLAVDYVIKHPVQTALLWPRKVFLLYLNDYEGISWSRVGSRRQVSDLFWIPMRGVAQFVYMAAFALAALAVVQLARKRLPAAWLGLAVVVYVTLVYLPFFGGNRYHFPLIPWLAIYASWAIVNWLDSKSSTLSRS